MMIPSAIGQNRTGRHKQNSVKKEKEANDCLVWYGMVWYGMKWNEMNPNETKWNQIAWNEIESCQIDEGSTQEVTTENEMKLRKGTEWNDSDYISSKF